MKVILSAAAGFVMSLIVTRRVRPQATPAKTDSGFPPFLRQFEEGIRQFVNGVALVWKQNASHRDDATIMGAWGAHEKGWNEAEARYDWAAARFRPSGAVPTFEYLASGVSGDLAYTVTIERSKVSVVGQDEPVSMHLRVTHLFRKEAGAWKMIHRHADPLIDKTAPTAVLRSET